MSYSLARGGTSVGDAVTGIPPPLPDALLVGGVSPVRSWLTLLSPSFIFLMRFFFRRKKSHPGHASKRPLFRTSLDLHQEVPLGLPRLVPEKLAVAMDQIFLENQMNQPQGN